MSLKLLTSILLIAFISGCIAQDKEENNMETISISSEAFKEGGTIPDEYSCEGNDISPPLSWQGVPAGTKSIALIMDDPDAPGRTFVHWVIYNIPGSTQKLTRGIYWRKVNSSANTQDRYTGIALICFFNTIDIGFSAFKGHMKTITFELKTIYSLKSKSIGAQNQRVNFIVI